MRHCIPVDGTRRFATLAAVLLFACLAGCLPSRGDVFTDVTSSRYRALVRWREQGADDHVLPQATGDLSLSDAVKLGLEFSPGLKKVIEEKRRAEGQLLTAYSEALPDVKASAGYTRIDPTSAAVSGIVQDTWSAGLTVTQPIFKGGAIPAAIRGAKYFELLSDETVRQGVQDTILSVAGSYYDVLLAQHLLQVQTGALEFAQKNLDDVTARENAGIAIPFDRLRAQVEVSNVQADMITQRNELNRARTALLRAMGVSQRSEVELTDELVYEPMQPDFEQAVEIAFMNRPELYRSELEARIQETVLRTLYSDYLPSLEGFYGHTLLKPDAKEAGRNDAGDEWSIGVRLNWTLFDGFRREGGIISQKATLQQALLELADVEQQVLEQVKNSILDVQEADELVKSQRLNLEQAEEALRLVQIGVKEGVNTELEVLDARSALTKTVGLYYGALYSHTIARLQLQRAIGLMGPRPGDSQVPEAGPALGVIPEFMPASEQDAEAITPEQARDLDARDSGALEDSMGGEGTEAGSGEPAAGGGEGKPAGRAPSDGNSAGTS